MEMKTIPDTVPRTAVGVLDRTMLILGAVEHGADTVARIADATGLTRPTTHRLVRSMEEHGLLRSAEGGSYRLGPRLLSLSAAFQLQSPLRELAHPMLERLTRTTGESAQLYVREGDVRVCIDAVESSNELRTMVRVGAALPLTRGSAGIVFLAATAGSDMDRLVAPLTPVEAERLRRAVVGARRRGWADSVGQREPGVASVSAPITDGSGATIAVASVSGPAERFGAQARKGFAKTVVETARAVEEALAGGRSHSY